MSVTSGEQGGESEESEERGDKELMERGVSESLSAWILDGSAPAAAPALPAAGHSPSPPGPAVLSSGLDASLRPQPATTSCSWMVVMELWGRKPPGPPSCRRLSNLFWRSGSDRSGCSR